MKDEKEPEDTVAIDRRKSRSAFEIISFKLDRTLAIIGIILIGITATDSQIWMAAVSGLVGYIGGRAGK